MVIAIYVASTVVFAALGFALIAVAFSGENRQGVIGAVVLIALGLGTLACAASAARFAGRCLGLGVVVDSSGVRASNPPDCTFVGWDQIQRFDVTDLPVLSGGLVHKLGSWVSPGDQPVPCVVVVTADGRQVPLKALANIGPIWSLQRRRAKLRTDDLPRLEAMRPLSMMQP